MRTVGKAVYKNYNYFQQYRMCIATTWVLYSTNDARLYKKRLLLTLSDSVETRINTLHEIGYLSANNWMQCAFKSNTDVNNIIKEKLQINKMSTKQLVRHTASL